MSFYPLYIEIFLILFTFLFIFGMQKKDKKTMLIFISFAAFSFSIYCFLIGAYVGSISSLIAVSRLLLINYLDKRKVNANRNFFIAIYTFLFISLSLLVWDGWYAIFLLVPRVFMNYLYFKDNVKFLKFGLIIESILIGVYLGFSGSISGVIVQGLLTIASFIGFVSFLKYKNKVKEKNL